MVWPSSDRPSDRSESWCLRRVVVITDSVSTGLINRWLALDHFQTQFRQSCSVSWVFMMLLPVVWSVVPSATYDEGTSYQFLVVQNWSRNAFGWYHHIPVNELHTLSGASVTQSVTPPAVNIISKVITYRHKSNSKEKKIHWPDVSWGKASRASMILIADDNRCGWRVYTHSERRLPQPLRAVGNILTEQSPLETPSTPK